MKQLQSALLLPLLLAVPACSSSATGGGTPAETKPDKAKLVGKWEVTGGDLANDQYYPGQMPWTKGVVWEFEKDGNVKVAYWVPNSNLAQKWEAKYEVADSNLNVSKDEAGKEEMTVFKIKQLTDTELKLQRIKGSNSLEFKKK